MPLLMIRVVDDVTAILQDAKSNYVTVMMLHWHTHVL